MAITRSQLWQQADVVVVGRSYGPAPEPMIEIERILKGAPPARLHTAEVGKGTSTRMSVPTGHRGVFFLQRRGDRFVLNHPDGVQPFEELDAIEGIVAMERNLSRGYDLDELNAELATAIAHGFREMRLTSPDYPQLDRALTNYERHFLEYFDWSHKALVEARVRVVGEAIDAFEIEIDEGCLESMAGFLRTVARGRAMDIRRGGLLQSEFTLRLDTRPIEVAGGISRHEAIAYLRACADSPDARFNHLGYEGLQRMRDQSSAQLVAERWETMDSSRQYQATSYLKRARVATTAEPLLRVFNMVNDGQSDLGLADQLAGVLVNIDHPDVLPALELAALNGVERAISGVARIGDTDSFHLLIEGLSNDDNGYGTVAQQLQWMMWRSNLPMEDWMKLNNPRPEQIEAVTQKWQVWWLGNQYRLKIEHANSVAITRWEASRS